MSTDDVCEVVVTSDSAEWLVGFTRRLVDDRLAAGGHNVTAIRSIYRWAGSVHDVQEARVAYTGSRSGRSCKGERWP
ncbi:divalent cation tolerance protein CutA [Planotetraspora kaengkrachanensis]|uniref:divalent cation tolerance protein CutA n=1 Tax=Planotetraspora kaengkrachanensis TaxID=575193 RepID=UPI001943CBE7